MSKKKRLICICSAAAVLVAALIIMIVLLTTGGDERSSATISVRVNGQEQKSGGSITAFVDEAYDITATASDKSSVKISYALGTGEAQAFAGGTFIPDEVGSYVFKLSANGAKTFVLTFNVGAGGSKLGVTFDLGNYASSTEVAPSSQNVALGNAVILPSAPAAADGYTFIGWFDGETVYGEGTAYTVEKIVSFTAVWEAVHGNTKQRYTVGYALGNHAASDASVPVPQSIVVGTEITLAAAPKAASGYVFLEWSDGIATYAERAKYTVKGDVTFTATWRGESTLPPAKYTILNGDFETGNLTGWTYQNGTGDGQILGAKAVSDATYFFDERVPFNQGGVYHFDGWKAKNDENETHTYSIKSTTFTLGGSGYISFKMAGNAACVMVYDADDDMPIAEYKNTAFSDENYPNLDEGCRNGTLTTFVADLSKHIGKQLYIELCDIQADTWGIAIFDDIVTYYATAPAVDGSYDTVRFYKGGYEAGKQTTEYRIPWVKATNSFSAAPTDKKTILSLGFEGTGFTEENANGSGSISAVNGVLNNPRFQDAPVQPYRPNGVDGKALSFDGYSQYLSFGGDVYGRALTIDVYVCPRVYAWSAPNSPPEAHAAHTIVGSFDSGAKTGFMLGITKFGYPTFRVGTGSDWYILAFPTNSADYRLPTYTWSRLTAVFDGMNGQMSLYVNGKLARTTEVRKGSSIMSSGKEILVGASSEAAYEASFEITKFNGLMDELSVVTEVNTAEQVAQKGKILPTIDYDAARLPDSALENDWYRPQYHAVPPGNWMNEPHALFHYNNKWHLFYQYNAAGPYWRNISWGHWVSDDMVQWKHVKEAVIPFEGTITPDGVWTGNVVYDKDNRPVLLITAGDDSRPYNGSNQHVGLAYAKDYNDPDLTDWVIGDFAVKQTAAMGTPGQFRDAQAFSVGDDRYMVVGGQIDGRGAAHLFKTNVNKSNYLSNWEYKGNLYRPSDWKDEYGPVWEMPNLVPLPRDNGTASGKYLFVFSPQAADFNVRYYIGAFNTNTCTFTPDFADAKRMDYVDNVFTGPTVYLDPQTNKVYICSIMQDQRWEEDRSNAGWAFAAGLPRELYLKSNGTLGIKHIDTQSAEGNTVAEFSGKSAAEANGALAAVNSDLIKIAYTISNANGEVGFRLKKGSDGYAKFYLTADRAGLDTESVNNVYQRAKGNFQGEFIRGNTVTGTIYIDKALIEIYFDGTATLSSYCYSKSVGLEVFGNATFSVKVTAMNSIHQ